MAVVPNGGGGGNKYITSRGLNIWPTKLLGPLDTEEKTAGLPWGQGVTPIDSIVMAVTAGQNFDQLFSAFDHWSRWFLGLWTLTALNFNCWPLTMRTFMEECIATPLLP